MSPATVRVVGLGPAGPELISQRTQTVLDGQHPVFLRTLRHPASAAVDAAGSFDDIYDGGETFAEVYETIVDRVVGLAAEHDRIVYAVPGSPRVLERTVALLASRRDESLSVEIEPAMSFLDLAWDGLELDPVEQGVRLIDGHMFEESVAGDSGPFMVAHCHSRRVLSDIKLAVDESPSRPVVVLHHLGLDDQAVFEVPWAELDRSFEPDHLTALYVPDLPNEVGRSFAGFGVLVDRLRRDCPWDAEQTHASLRKHLLEETYEVLEAIDAVDALGEPVGELDEAIAAEAYAELCEELGDLLYQVFFHALLAHEQGRFDTAAVADGITAKLTVRHPHVFGDVDATGADEVLSNWEAAKLEEKGRGSVMDGIPTALPAALYAAKVIKKARTTGIDPGSVDLSVLGAAQPIAIELFDVIDRCVEAKIDAESVLREVANAVNEHVRSEGR